MMSCLSLCRSASAVDGTADRVLPQSSSSVDRAAAPDGSAAALGPSSGNDHVKFESVGGKPKPQREKSIYHESVQNLLESHGDDPIPKDDSDVRNMMESLGESMFFDAAETEEEMERVAAYPPVTTTELHSKRFVSMVQPDTLLRDGGGGGEPKKAEAGGDSSGAARAFRQTVAVKGELERPSVLVEEKGFPGNLTQAELETTQRFYRELKKKPPSYSEIVFNMHKREEEPYALCRFLRARKFDIEKVFEMIDEAVPVWEEGKANDFYPDKEKALGCPVPVFLTQYPDLYFGTAKNGCPVTYFMAGKIKAEGMLALTTVEKCNGYFWHQYVFEFDKQLGIAQKANPDVVRCEAINVIDLAGLSASQVNADAMSVIKVAAKIATCYPETLHCLVILNAPGFFSFSWRIIKTFIDARTASKIEVYSSSSKGLARLQELVDKSQIPSDYGGTARSTSEEIDRQSGQDSPDQRQLVKVFHIKKSKPYTYEFDVKPGEEFRVCVYTRSPAGAEFITFKETASIKKTDVPPAETVENGDKNNKSMETKPFCTEVASGIKGPGKFRLEATTKKGGAYDYFVVAIDLKKSTS